MNRGESTDSVGSEDQLSTQITKDLSELAVMIAEDEACLQLNGRVHVHICVYCLCLGSPKYIYPEPKFVGNTLLYRPLCYIGNTYILGSLYIYTYVYIYIYTYKPT